MHVACVSGQRDSGTSSSIGAGVHTDLEIGNVLHADIIASAINVAGDGESTIGRLVSSVVRVRALDRCLAVSDWRVGTVIVVDAHGIATTTVLGRVASAWREAVSKVSGARCSVSRQCRAAEALVRVLETGVWVAFGLAVVHAALDSDVVGPPGIRVECSVTAVVGSAAKVSPPSGVDIVGLRSSDARGDIAVGHWRSVCVFDRVAAW